MSLRHNRPFLGNGQVKLKESRSVCPACSQLKAYINPVGLIGDDSTLSRCRYGFNPRTGFSRVGQVVKASDS